MSQDLLLERDGIGTRWWIGENSGIGSDARAALVQQLNEIIDTFDRRYSRFRPDSLVTRLNNTGKLQVFPAELYEMIRYSEHLREVSDGLFNIGVGAQLESLGYDADYSFEAKDNISTVSGSVVVELSTDHIRLRPGSRIDLGGIGKGWLIDRLCEVIGAAGVDSYYVNGGGDLRAVSEGPPWQFMIEDAANAAMAIGEVTLMNGALAGSGAGKRSWTDVRTGRRHHHLLNPALGLGHDGPLGVYTYGATATQADAASTILYLAPAADVVRLAQELGVEYLIMYSGGRVVRSEGYPGKLYEV